jgi:hypothetical protein
MVKSSINILKFNEFVNENFGLKEHDGILIIVDVQKEFGDFINNELVKSLFEYCNEFKEVYQIWDNNKAKSETFTFPNQKQTIKKKYGKSFLDSNITAKLDDMLNDKKEGEIVILENFDGQFVRVDNNHEWFLVTGDMIDLFNKLKGKNVIITGGASEECILDVLVACKSFGINIVENHKYIYGAENKKQPKLK